MPKYLVAIHHRDNYDPSVLEDEAISRDMDLLKSQMVAASFACKAPVEVRQFY